MSVIELIENIVPVLKPKDTVDDALRMMSETHYSKLPLINKKVYVNYLSEADLLDWEDPDTLLSDFKAEIFRPSVIGSAHPFDAAKVSMQHNLPVVPILDNKQLFLGSVSRAHLFNYLCQQSSIAQDGSIIVLEVKPGDFVLSQIAKIAENEEVIIMNMSVFQDPQSGILNVTLKTNKMELQRLVAAFERYEYNVVEIYGDVPTQTELDDRYKLLMNYLNM